MKSLYASLISLLLFAMTSTVVTADILQPGFYQYRLAEIAGRSRAFGMDIADFNNDTIPDILSGDTYGDIHLFAGNGDGTFTDNGIVINQAYHNAYGLASADFNNDGNADFVLTMRDDYTLTSPPILSGEVYLYLGNGDGSFQSTGFPQVGLLVGDAGTASCAVAAGDVDGDNDIDIIAGDITASENSLADVVLFRNLGNDAYGNPIWDTPEILISGQDLGYSPNPELPPYYPPKSSSNIDGYGLALADMDGDEDVDLMLTDAASYVYVYLNDGSGVFSPVLYNKISTGTRPFAYARCQETFTTQLSIDCGDLNGDGMTDFAVGGSAGIWSGTVDLWLNTGNVNGAPEFLYAGTIGSEGTEARGLAIGQLNSLEDDFLDIAFGNKEAVVSGLFTNRGDSDMDGIIDLFDNAPLHPNAPRLDMNDDGGINYLDQLDNDQDGVGDPADDDDDNDGIPDVNDNSPFVPNFEQLDFDQDGRGDVSDPLNNTDTDSDGIFDGPLDPYLYGKAMQAKAVWSNSDTHFIIRIDALGRVFQNEFTQTMTDAAILSPEEWELNRNYSYNGVGDEPAAAGYQVPLDLPGGKNTPISLAVIPRKIWNAYGDDDPIRWMNARISNPKLELGQHGTYHANNTLNGDWSDDSSLNNYSCETCGFTLEEMYQYLRIGQRTMLGDYGDMWIIDSGADPDNSPKVDWTNAANPFISYVPPYNASDTISRDAVSRLYFTGFSASTYEENSIKFTPEGTHHEMFDDFGIFHASADMQVNPENYGYATYLEYLQSITQAGELNTWLIEEVEWSTRYCNDLDRLEYCDVSDALNRENNMVDLERWEKWMTLLEYVNSVGQPMTLGDYSLAMAFDNAPTVSNADQADSDHDGIGDVIDGAVLVAANVEFNWSPNVAGGVLEAVLTNSNIGIVGQTIIFSIDTDGDGAVEEFTAVTDDAGIASVYIELIESRVSHTYTAEWDGVVMQLSGQGVIDVNNRIASDLNGDGFVRLDDFAILAMQWQLSDEPDNCLLSAELAGDDCFVTIADFEFMVSEWMNQVNK